MAKFRPIKRSALRRALLQQAERLFNRLDPRPDPCRACALEVAALVERGCVSKLRFTFAVPELWPAIELISIELPMPHPLLQLDAGVMLDLHFWNAARLPEPAGCKLRGGCGTRGWIGTDADSLRIVDLERGRPCPSSVTCKPRTALQLAAILDDARTLDRICDRFCAWGSYR